MHTRLAIPSSNGTLVTHCTKS